MAVDPDEFQNIMNGLVPSDAGDVAVGVSGGADSVALAACVVRWAKDADVSVHILSVDHGLRAGATDDVAHVAALAEALEARFEALKWEHDGVEGRVQEAARAARYDLMAEYCAAHDVAHLCLGHHMDDQAETVLFRLCKGSGLDGLGGMRGAQVLDNGLTLLRPFLGVAKADLLAFCEAQGLAFVDDPSNDDAHYARVRLRNARAALEAEGLSAKRLSVTARRLLRARDALDEITGVVYDGVVLEMKSDRIVFKVKALSGVHEEVGLRCVLRALSHFRAGAAYQPRMEKIEALFADVLAMPVFRKRTLGGVIFERDDDAGLLILQAEG